MEDFLEVLLVGFTCNLVVGVDDVKWVHQEVTNHTAASAYTATTTYLKESPSR